MTTKILVADDSATMRRVLEMTFAGEDAQVQTVGSAQAALEAARELSPDVVFADASMEGSDGYDLAQQLKGDPALATAAVILMASQHAPYDEGRGRAAGVDDHISKPFDTQSVIDRMSQVLARPRAQAEAAAPPMPAEPPARPAPPAPAAPPAPPVDLGPPKVARHSMGGGPLPTRPSGNHTVMGVGALSSPPAPPAPPAAPARQPSTPPPAAAPAVARPAAAATAPSSNLAGKLGDLGLTAAQIEGVLALSREVIEQVVWEVVPELAETLIKEELARLTSD